MKGLPRQNLQALQVNPVPPVKLKVTPGEVVPDDSNQFYRAEKACGHRRVAGGAAEQARIFRRRGFD
jgi:hypothetical protein